MLIEEIMEKAAEAARPYTDRLGSAVVQDIGQDAVLAVWQASERGETLDIVSEVRRGCFREYEHLRGDRGLHTVPLDEAPEWSPTTNDAGKFGMARQAVPGVTSMTRYELMLEAVQAVDGAAYAALLEWQEASEKQYRVSVASGGKKSGKPRRFPEELSGPIKAELPAVLAWWAHRTRERSADDWQTARAMSPTTERVASPAELSDSNPDNYLQPTTRKKRPTPVRVHTTDHEADAMAMMSFGAGAVRKPSRRKKGGSGATGSTVTLGPRRWADVGNKAG